MDETSLAMAVRTGNWGPSVLLPFHRPVRVTLAPVGDADQLVAFDAPLMSVPRSLGREEIRALTLIGPQGRDVLSYDDRGTRLDPDDGAGVGGGPHATWELRIEGHDGVLILYSLPGCAFPSSDVVAELGRRLDTARLGAAGASGPRA